MKKYTWEGYEPEHNDWNDPKWSWDSLCETGLYCPSSTINDASDAWHTSKIEKSLHEFLGLTWEEFKLWVETNRFPERIMKKGCKH